MIFTDEERVRRLGNISADVDIENFQDHLRTGKLDVLDVIGKEVYEKIYNEDGYDAEDIENIAIAESYMCLKYVVPNFNLQSSGNGFTKSQGTGNGKQEALSESDIETMITRYDDNATKILKRYVIAPDNDYDKKPDVVVSNKISMVSI